LWKIKFADDFRVLFGYFSEIKFEEVVYAEHHPAWRNGDTGVGIQIAMKILLYTQSCLCTYNHDFISFAESL